MLKRFLLFLGDEDRAIMALFGSKAFKTISGSVGRACGDGGGKPRAWGPYARALIEFFPWWGRGHCKYWAEREQKIQQALDAVGLSDI